MNNKLHRALALAGATALLVPAAAVAKPGKGHGKGHQGAQSEQVAKAKGKGKGKGHTKRTHVIKGTVAAVDGSSLTVTPKKRGKSRRHSTEPVTIAVTEATKVVVDDGTDDRKGTFADVRVGDRVVVQTRRSAAGEFVARKIVVQREDDAAAETVEQPAQEPTQSTETVETPKV